MKRKLKTPVNVVKMGVLFLVGSLFVFAIYFSYSRLGRRESVKSDAVKAQKVSKTYEEPSIDRWKAYENKKFGFSVKHPPVLYTNYLENVGGYEMFVRFEEVPEFTTEAKGVGVGVSSLPTASEVERIKKQIEGEGDAILEQDHEIVFQGFTARRLYYKPKDSKKGEERVIVIVRQGNYTYSMSTTPEQIDRVLSGFSFLK